MAGKTINYNLKKPAENEYYNIDDFNYNSDIIDEELKKLEDGKETPSGAQAKANTALASAKGYTDEEIQLIAAELGDKVDKVNGKGLSSNDFDNTEKQNLKTVFDSFVGRDLFKRSVSNANDAVLTGFYYLSAIATNKPTGITDGALFTMSHSNVWVTQLVIDWRTNKSYSRVCNNGVWTAWQEVYHSGNLGNVDNIKQMPLTGGTFTGKTIMQNNTDYSKQGRNITLSTADPSGGASGDIWIKYKA